MFPVLNRAEALRRLTTAGVQTKLPTGVSSAATSELIGDEFVDDLSAVDFDAGDITAIEQAAGFRPTWGLEIAISGRFPDWRQRDLRVLTAWLLSDGGVASSCDVDEFRTAEGWRSHWASLGESI